MALSDARNVAKDVGISESTITDFSRLLIEKNAELPAANQFTDDDRTEKLLSSVVLPATLAIDTSTIGAPIEYQTVTQTASGANSLSVSLNMAVYTYNGPAVVQNTRGYNGELLGPTIRVNPGDTLTITLTNSLSQEGFDTGSLHNQYRQFDVTNLHTHGLHVSGEAPGDSIFTPLGDLATIVCSYDRTMNYTSNSLARYFHDLGICQARLNTPLDQTGRRCCCMDCIEQMQCLRV